MTTEGVPRESASATSPAVLPKRHSENGSKFQPTCHRRPVSSRKGLGSWFAAFHVPENVAGRQSPEAGIACMDPAYLAGSIDECRLADEMEADEIVQELGVSAGASH
jgi:hypothetical protein